MCAGYFQRIKCAGRRQFGHFSFSVIDPRSGWQEAVSLLATWVVLPFLLFAITQTYCPDSLWFKGALSEVQSPNLFNAIGMVGFSTAGIALLVYVVSPAVANVLMGWARKTLITACAILCLQIGTFISQLFFGWSLDTIPIGKKIEIVRMLSLGLFFALMTWYCAFLLQTAQGEASLLLQKLKACPNPRVCHFCLGLLFTAIVVCILLWATRDCVWST